MWGIFAFFHVNRRLFGKGNERTKKTYTRSQTSTGQGVAGLHSYFRFISDIAFSVVLPYTDRV
jgi:hypothetical protein